MHGFGVRGYIEGFRVWVREGFGFLLHVRLNHLKAEQSLLRLVCRIRDDGADATSKLQTKTDASSDDTLNRCSKRYMSNGELLL